MDIKNLTDAELQAVTFHLIKAEQTVRAIDDFNVRNALLTPILQQFSEISSENLRRAVLSMDVVA
jgi:hypothetical protein